MAEQNQDLLRRAEDLREQCERNASVTHTLFLTPAEQYVLSKWASGRNECRLIFKGADEASERKVAFFLPFWFEETSDPAEDLFHAVKIQAYFGQPDHRDYMGSILGLGIKREWVGDIVVQGDAAFTVCLGAVGDSICTLEKVGRVSVKAAEIPLSDFPSRKQQFREISFTVMSPRLDAILGSVFNISRTLAAKLIRGGLAQLNYTVCIKTDADVKPGDVLTLRGYGKAILDEQGGVSRKGRTFYSAKIYT